MNQSIFTKAKDDKGNSATLEFLCHSGKIYVHSADFQLAQTDQKQPPSPELMRVRGYWVSEKYSSGHAYIHGVRGSYHVAWDSRHRRSLLRIFRRLIQQRLDDDTFRNRLHDHSVRVAYAEAVGHIRSLERSLVSAKANRTAILKKMVENKRRPRKSPRIKLPLIK